MNNQSTIELLREMKFSAMAHELSHSLRIPKHTVHSNLKSALHYLWMLSGTEGRTTN